MGFEKHLRILTVVALVGGILGATAATASADDSASSGVVDLDDKFEGWFSNGMDNNSEACGPFAASADAVVWHLYTSVPEGLDLEDVNVADIDFGASVASEIKVAVNGTQVDMWARVTVKDATKDAYVRQGAHTSIKKAKLHFSNPDVRHDKDATIQLGSVCYEGLGPIGRMTIYLQGLVCDGYDRFAGNEINDGSSNWDSTAGDWELWNKVYNKNAPTVRVVGKTKGCAFSGSQQFAVGTSAGMANRHVIQATTNAAENGLIRLSSADLPIEHQRALFWANQELWFERIDGQALGAFQCYDDRLHPDNFEWILIRDYDKLPSSMSCIAWNVTAASG